MSRARDLAAFVSNADGDIKFDTDTLFIDSSANRVGIGETTPARQLHVDGSEARLVRLSHTSNPKLEFLDTTDGTSGAYLGSEDNELTFETNGQNERMRIDSNGKVGIGATPPSDWTTAHKGLQVGKAVLYDNGSNDTFIGTNFYYDGSNNKYVASATASTLGFLDGGFKFYTAASGTAGANVSFSEKVRILQGGGITFNGDSAAANALDDYEEGTWTPTGNGVTLQFEHSAYVKVGRLVHITSYLQIPTTSNTSLCTIGGLPFTAKTATNLWQGLGMGWNDGLTTPHYFILPNNSDTAQLRIGSTGNQVQNASVSSRQFMLTATYYTN